MLRSVKTIMMGLFVSLLALGALAEKKSDAAEAKINWMPLDKGIEALEADTTGKHVFIDVTASWCGWCKKMDRETFADPDVIKLLNDSFISVKLWGDSDNVLNIKGYQISERNLAKGEFKVSGYPGFYFITPDNKKFPIQGGYKTKEALMNVLTYMNTKAYEADLKKAEQSQPENK